MIIDLEMLNNKQALAIKLIAISVGDIIVMSDGTKADVKLFRQFIDVGIIHINDEAYSFSGDDIVFRPRRESANNIVDVIFTEKGNH